MLRKRPSEFSVSRQGQTPEDGHDFLSARGFLDRRWVDSGQASALLEQVIPQLVGFLEGYRVIDEMRGSEAILWMTKAKETAGVLRSMTCVAPSDLTSWVL